ncbi:hypothetical protein cce_4972 [Crocosphaera subtropica ATCC 51142]|uniref:Uncharacterized protein n=1 Tax=Crocosphaera subtropica (strain ATCC 51142 / BH68) TaxID=43989 RepID=B1X2F7_CROS5|nr:hypothetical protein [Crocosphaera subtropica]ACB54318.1 hypothetical protein cce_4972 [Crocosphaera subtropica ATCC 51142]
MEPKPNREKAILWLSDDDLELIGIDPASISDELFEAIAEELKEFINEGFQHALIQSVESAKVNQES